MRFNFADLLNFSVQKLFGDKIMRFIPLFSGSSGNCSVIQTEKATLLVDAGLTGKAVCGALASAGINPASIDGILVTHDHIDHTRAVGILSRKYDMPVYANAGTWEAMNPIVKQVDFRNVRVFRTDEDFYIGDINILPFKTPHDAKESVGFIFISRGSKLAYMTDIGCVHESMLNPAAGAQLVFIESNHDVQMLKTGPYPYVLKKRILSDNGHLSNADCGAALVRLYSTGVRRAVLGHLSQENNTEETAFSTVTQALEAAGISDMQLVVAKRDGVTGVFEV